MIKKLAYTVLGIIVLGIIAMIFIVRQFNNTYFGETPNYLECKQDTTAMKFQWAKESYDDYQELHVAMLVSARLDSLPYRFYFQFDTGSPYTFIYGKPLKTLKELGALSTTVDDSGDLRVEEASLNLGGSAADLSMIKVKENYGMTFTASDTTKWIKLGTIGSDFLDRRVTAIDFKQNKINFFNQRPQWMNTAVDFHSFDFTGRRFMLPVEIEGKEMELFYDSGCSAFGLITSKHRYERYADRTKNEISYEGSRWGESLPIFHRPSDSRLMMAGGDLPLTRISYVDLYGPFQRFMTPFTHIGGWLGNKPFLNHVLILDAKASEYGVMQSNH